MHFGNFTDTKGVALSPLILPAVVLGFALFSIVNSFELENYSMLNLIAGHILITIPFVVRSVWSAMAGTNISLEEAAKSMGASPFVVFRKVVLPMARPGIMAGAVLAFTYSFNDIAISIFLVGAETTTLPVEVMSNMEYSADPTPAAVSTIMVFITVVFFVLVDRIGGMKLFISK
jgi:putative spermidine/putrescine transport system permease protein